MSRRYRIESCSPTVSVRAASVFHQPRGASAGSESAEASGAPRSFSDDSSDLLKAAARSAGVKTWGASTKTAVDRMSQRRHLVRVEKTYRDRYPFRTPFVVLTSAANESKQSRTDEVGTYSLAEYQRILGVPVEFQSAGGTSSQCSTQSTHPCSTSTFLDMFRGSGD